MKKVRISSQKVPMGEVRVIAGVWRGRKLPVLHADGLRPTTDRMKETLFNWLMNDVADARCLDCFAGSGSLGIEALSRQAQSVTFLEKSAQPASQLKRNLVSLKTEKGTVIHTDSLLFLAQQNQDKPFDLVFVDPPFHHQLVPPVLAHLHHHGWLADGAWVYVETEKSHPPLELPVNWQCHKEKIAGQVLCRLYRYQQLA